MHSKNDNNKYNNNASYGATMEKVTSGQWHSFTDVECKLVDGGILRLYLKLS